MDTPVIDLTAAPDSPVRRGADGGQQLGPSSSSSSSSSSSEGASASTRRTEAQQQDTRNSNAAAGSITSNATVNTRRRLPYPRANAADTPIDLTDDDIEYLGEHRLHLPDQHHVEGNEARPVAGDNYSLMGQSTSIPILAYLADSLMLTPSRPTSKCSWYNAILKACFNIK